MKTEIVQLIRTGIGHQDPIIAPVGLAIGSKTAPEIAVAILAELTLIRRAREKAAASRIASLEA